MLQKSCAVNTLRFLKHVWPFYNIMHERDKPYIYKKFQIIIWRSLIIQINTNGNLLSLSQQNFKTLSGQNCVHHFSAIKPRDILVIRGYGTSILSLKLSTSGDKTKNVHYRQVKKIYCYNYYGNSISHEYIYFLGYDQLSG